MKQSETSQKGQQSSKSQTKTTPQIKTSKGIIRIPLDLNLEKLKPWLHSEANRIIEIKKLFNRLGKATGQAIVHFSTEFAPIEINCGTHNISVNQLLLNIIRCAFCQKFGHHSSTCRSNFIACMNCGGWYHSVAQYRVRHISAARNCTNCNGSHSADYCSVFLNIRLILMQNRNGRKINLK